MKTGVIILGTVALASVVIYFVIRPKYEFNHYELKGCQNTSLTAVVYWKLGERGIIFTKGNYQEKPEKNYVKNNQMSGFDAFFDCIATCRDGIITLNYYEGYFVPDFTADNIRLRRVNDDIYDSLMEKSGGTHIRLY